MNYASSPELRDGAMSLELMRAKFGPIAAVILLHAIVVYAIYSGMLTRVVEAAIPHSVMVEFVASPEKAPPPAAPKVIPVVQLQPPTLPQVPVPVVQIAQVQNTITVEQAAVPAPKPATPVAVVAEQPAAPGSGAPKTITSGIQYLQAPQTVYPQMSKRMGEQGKVVLRILVNEKGVPDQVTVQTSSGFSRLDEAGRQAGMRALFKPHLEDGRAVPVYVLIPLNFQLS